MNANDRNLPLVLVAGKHTDEVITRFKNLSDCRVVFAEKMEDIKDEDLAEVWSAAKAGCILL